MEPDRRLVALGGAGAELAGCDAGGDVVVQPQVEPVGDGQGARQLADVGLCAVCLLLARPYR